MFKISYGKGVFCFVLFIFLLLIVKTPVAGTDGKIIFSHKGTLWTMNSDGTNQQTLGIKGSHPRWSPDGSQIVFTVYHRGDKAQGKNWFTETFIINIDGSNQRLLMSTEHLQEKVDFAPVWSPVGSRIAFYSNRPGRDDIFVIDVSGENLTNLTQSPETHERAPSWSPDGKHILYSSWEGHFHTLRLADGHRRQLTQGEGDRRKPDWSPDGKHIAFAGDVQGERDNLDIYIMDIETGVEKRLTIHPDNDLRPAWSPDGIYIVFQSERGDRNLDLYRITVISREVVRLTHLHEANGFSPDWCCVGQKPTAVNSRHRQLIRWGQLKADHGLKVATDYR